MDRAPHRVGIFGATGTSGTELVRLLIAHPQLRIAFATSRGHAGETLDCVDPAAPRVPLTHPDDVDCSDVEMVFTCLPHRASAPVVARARAAGAKVVDLSGDFRLRSAAAHETVYGSPRDEELAARAVYGLTEWARGAITSAELVANPGCYPTCAGLGLAPLVKRGWVEGPVVVDAKSGVSGAGRGPSPTTQFTAVADDVRPYKLGRAHRHVAELEQTLSRVAPTPEDAPTVVFNPHVVPIERGMLATMVVRVPGREVAEIRRALDETYRDEPLIDVLPTGNARIRAVVRGPGAQIGAADVPGTDMVVVTSSIDNLGKGAASQAIQNANRMLGLPERSGLSHHHPESR